MENTVSKQRLIQYLSLVRDAELSKPIDEIQPELVYACVKLLLKLQNKEFTLTTEQIQEKVRKIPFVLSADFEGESKVRTKKHITKKRILFVAALIALLAALLITGTTYTEDWSLFEYIQYEIGFDNVVYDKEYTHNGSTYISNEIIEMYEDIEDYPEDNPYDILLPTYLPDKVKMRTLTVGDMVENYRVSFGFNDSTLGYTIYLDTQIPQEILVCCDEKITIDDKIIYIINLPDIGTYQMYFEYNGDYYELGYTDKQILLKIIENLEE